MLIDCTKSNNFSRVNFYLDVDSFLLVSIRNCYSVGLCTYFFIYVYWFLVVRWVFETITKFLLKFVTHLFLIG